VRLCCEPLEERVLLSASNPAYLTQVYRDLLQRPPDGGGLAFWQARLDQGASRLQVVRAIEASVEYRSAEVWGLYLRLLARYPDPPGFSAAIAFLQAGGAVDRLAAAVIGSPEYFIQHGQAGNAGFLIYAYRDTLGRFVDASGGPAFGVALATGAASRTEVATILLHSPEGRREQVQDLYYRFLSHAPDAQGLSFFVSAAAAGVSQDDIVASLLTSAEYDARVSPG
jgi:hypothetical protein